MTTETDNDDIWGDDSPTFALPNDHDDEHEETDDTEVEDAEDETDEVEGDETETDEETDDEEDGERDPDLLPEPILVGNVWCTTVSQLTKQALTAQEQIDKTARTEREPTNQNPLAGLGGESGNAWELAYNAMDSQTQAQLQGMWESDPESVAKGAWTNYTILGAELSQHLYDLWADANPRKAIQFELEQGALTVQGQTPQADPYLEQMAFERQSEEAESLLANTVPNWTPEVSMFVGQFIQENAAELGLENSGSTPEEMATFVASVYYWLKGQDKIPAPGAEVEATAQKTTTSKKRAHSPVKSSAAPAKGGNEDLDDWDTPSGFQLPKIPSK